MITHKKDTTIKVHQGEKLKKPVRIRDTKINDKVAELLKLIKNKNSQMIFVSGPAGTAKTFSAVLGGLQLLNNKRISNIYYVRNVVESASQKMGHLPGDVASKLNPFLDPLMDKLEELLCKGDIDLLTGESGFIQGMPVNFLRGRNWNAKYVIIDEAQNLTEHDLITVMTRMGEYGKTIICADPYQSDIGNKSGFVKIKQLFTGEDCEQMGIYSYEFTDDDIVRSELVKFIVKKLNSLKS